MILRNGCTSEKPLFKQHREELLASGLTDETIEAAGIYSTDSRSQIGNILGWDGPWTGHGPAMVFPFPDLEGRVVLERIKADSPRILDRKPVKYESPRESGNHAYFPPGVAAVVQDREAKILITEGEKKALKATQEGFPCIGLSGVYNWKNKGSDDLIDSLDQITWAGRLVYLVFDSDLHEKQGVRQALARLARQLKLQGANVKWIDLPDTGQSKTGVDDFLVARGRAEFQQLVDQAGDTVPVAKRKAKELDAADEAEAFLQDSAHLGIKRWVCWKGQFYYWQDGVYGEESKPDVRAKLTLFLNGRFQKLTRTRITDVLDQMEAQAAHSGNDDPPFWIGPPTSPWDPNEILAAPNGIIHWPSSLAGKDYLAPTPRYFNLNKIGCPFNPQAPSPARWIQFLDEIFDDDQESIDALQEWFGYCLTPNTSQQKLLLMVGRKRSGKGTIQKVLQHLVGVNSVVFPQMGSLANAFGVQPLIGKSVAIIADARLGAGANQSSVVERLLSISGEDPQTISRKYLVDLTTRLPVRFMICSNESLSLTDASCAPVSRIVAIRMTSNFYGKEDQSLAETLLDELGGILIWSLDGLQRLRTRGHFIQPPSGQEILDDMQGLANPVDTFVRERCQLGKSEKVAAAALYHAYEDWCEDNGQRPCNSAVFGKNLKAAYPDVKKSRPSKDNPGRAERYVGIGLVFGH